MITAFIQGYARIFFHSVLPTHSGYIESQRCGSPGFSLADHHICGTILSASGLSHPDTAARVTTLEPKSNDALSKDSSWPLPALLNRLDTHPEVPTDLWPQCRHPAAHVWSILSIGHFWEAANISQFWILSTCIEHAKYTWNLYWKAFSFH